MTVEPFTFPFRAPFLIHLIAAVILGQIKGVCVGKGRDGVGALCVSFIEITQSTVMITRLPADGDPNPILLHVAHVWNSIWQPVRRQKPNL